MVHTKLCYMTNVMNGADSNVAIFPKKSYREKKTKSSGFISFFSTKNVKVSLCKAYIKLCPLIVIKICIYQT